MLFSRITGLRSLAVLLTCAVLLVIVACSSGSNVGEFRDITVTEAYQMIQQHDNNTVLLDLRTPVEFAEGHLSSAVNIDFRDAQFSENLKHLDRNKRYVLICRTGNRTSQAMPVFRDLGFTSVLNVTGGMVEWTARNLPY